MQQKAREQIEKEKKSINEKDTEMWRGVACLKLNFDEWFGLWNLLFFS